MRRSYWISVGAGLYPLPCAAGQGAEMDRGKVEFTGESAALCECGSEDLRTVRSPTEYEQWARIAHTSEWRRVGADREYAEIRTLMFAYARWIDATTMSLYSPHA